MVIFSIYEVQMVNTVFHLSCFFSVLVTFFVFKIIYNIWHGPEASQEEGGWQVLDLYRRRLLQFFVAV